jgi:hypothetical protein
MSEAVKELIQQALDQDFNQANKTFGDVMTVKLSDVLDQEQVRLADQIYNGIDPEDEEEDPDIEAAFDEEESGEDVEIGVDDEGDDDGLEDDGLEWEDSESDEDDEDSEES